MRPINRSSHRAIALMPRLCAFGLLLTASAASGIVSTQLTEAQAPDGRVAESRISPDSNWVVYRVNLEAKDRFELFSRPLAGGPSIRLNPPLPRGSTVESFSITDDSRVVFMADSDQAGKYQLYSVPIAGGATAQLSGTMVDGGDVVSWQVDPSHSRLVYVADQSRDEVYEIYSVPLTGGVPVLLAGPSQTGGTGAPSRWIISLDGSRVVFLADHQTLGVAELFSVPIDGGAVTRLSPSFTEGSISSSIVSSPDGSRILFAGDLDAPFDRHLFSVPTAGGVATRLTPDFTLGAGVREWQVSPNSDYAVFVSDHGTNSVYQIYSVPIDGGTVTRLNGTLVNQGDVSWRHFEMHAGTQTVLYLAEQHTVGTWELFRVPIAGGTATRIHQSLTADESVSSFFRLTAGGTVRLGASLAGLPFQYYSVPLTGGTLSRINAELAADESMVGLLDVAEATGRALYRVQKAGESGPRLYSSSLVGDSPEVLSPLPLEGGSLFGFELSPDGTQAFYTSNQDSVAYVELYQVPTTGGSSIKVNDPIQAVTGLIADGYELSSSTQRVVTRAQHHTVGKTELYSASLLGDSSIRLHDELPPFAQVQSFQLSPDGLRAVFLGDLNLDGVQELFSVPADGGQVVQLNTPLAGDFDVGFFYRISPDSSTVFYLVSDTATGASELFSVPIIGGSPTSLLAPGVEISQVEVDPSGQFLLYILAPNSSDRLFRLPVGGGTPTELNAPLAAGEEVLNFDFSPDGATVVYFALGPFVNGWGLAGLFSVPVVGGPVTELNDHDTLRASSTFKFTADSRHVVFSGIDADTESKNLYSVPITGTVPIRLSPDAADNTRIFLSYRISPDSSTLVYLADQDIDLVYELYSVPILGGTVSKLNPPLADPFTVSTYRIAPDSTTVIYLSNQEDSLHRELFSVPIRGGQSTRITPDLSEPDGRVEGDYRLSHDGRFVFYRAGPLNGGGKELFRIPIQGGSPVRLHPAAVEGGIVQQTGSVSEDFLLTSDDSRVIFAGDLAVRGVYELWTTRLDEVLFCDGFESGDTSAWSAASP